MGIRVGPFQAGIPATDNLVFFADAGNANSLDASAQIWTDLSTNAQDADISTVSIGANLNFNGNTSIASFGANAKMADIFETGGTIAFWVRPESDGEGNEGRIMDKAGWHCEFVNEAASELELQFTTIQATINGAWTSSIVTDPIDINQWVEI